MSHQSLTLALGGGGARGVAHLGVIEEILRAGWRIEHVIGISIGSMAGAMYAFDPDIERVQQRTLEFLLSPEFESRQRALFRAQPGYESTRGGFFSWYHHLAGYLQAHQMLSRAVTRRSLLPGAMLEEVVNNLLPDADIADAHIPLGIAAVDLLNGERVVLERGPLRSAVQASASLPGIFPPVEFDGRLLCDLGVLASLPVRIARMYEPETLIGVDVGSNLKPFKELATALDVLMRIIDIGEATFRSDLRAEADLVIAPEVGDIEWWDFSNSERLIDVGRTAARQALHGFSPTRTMFKRVWNSLRSLRRLQPAQRDRRLRGKDL